MTAVETLKRCRRCGRHRDAETEFRSGRLACRNCETVQRRARRPTTAPAERPQSTTSPTPSWPGSVPAGRTPGVDAAWHQCDGKAVHPAHRQTHREGFWTEGHLEIRFIEGFCVYPDGERHGEAVDLMPYQREVLLQGYRLRPDGLRQYQRWLIGVPKKNAKTALVGWLGLYHTVSDTEPSPFNVCAAANDDQADLIFEAARATAEHGDGARFATPAVSLRTATERWEREILVPERPGARLRRLASGGGNLDGPNLYFRGLDELHEWMTPKNRQTYTVLAQGGALRRQPLLMMITTAGWDRDSLLFALYVHGQRVAAKPDLDPTFFFVWFEAPEKASGAYAGMGPYERRAGEAMDFRSREAWETANPAAGYTVTYERYLEDLRDPQMTEGVARRYRLNQWTETKESWLPRPWESYLAPGGVILGEGLRSMAALDSATLYDSTAISVWQIEGTGAELRVRNRTWAWERPLDPSTGQHDEHWRTPFIEVRAHLYSLHFGTEADGFWCAAGACACGCGEAFPPLRLEAVGFDTSRITMMTEEWSADGLPMVEIPQTDARMVPGFQAFYQLLAEGRYQHDGEEALARHIHASVARQARAGGRRLARAEVSVRRPNDAAITQVMCAYLLHVGHEEHGEPHVY